MDEYNNEKNETFMDNILTMAGAACLMYPLIRQATKALAPEIQKLTSGEALQELKTIPDKQEKYDGLESKDSYEHEIKQKSDDDEISELKRKLAEYEKKSDEQKSEN